MVRWRKMGVVAGGGALPARVADACAARGQAAHVVRIAGMADASTKNFDGADFGIGEIGKIVRSLKSAGCDAVVLAGTVRRPDFKRLIPDWRGASLLPRVLAAAAKGDGAVLSVLVEMFEAEGFLVVGADEVACELAMKAGALGMLTPLADDFSDMRKAAAVIDRLGPFDVGQAVVVANGQVLAVEAAEGTDAMLERCAQLRSIDGERSGVLVKRPKPRQELRVDLPTLGVATVTLAAAAGLRGIAAQSGLALLIDSEEAAAQADRAGIFLYGFEASEVDAA